MTPCAYCESTDGVTIMTCMECEADCCAGCSHWEVNGLGMDVLCNPDPNTWPGRGCYKPPVAES